MYRKHYNGKLADSQLKDTGKQVDILLINAVEPRTVNEEGTNEISLALFSAIHTNRHCFHFLKKEFYMYMQHSEVTASFLAANLLEAPQPGTVSPARTHHLVLLFSTLESGLSSGINAF